MGRPPIGKSAMTAAERQRRHRAGLGKKPEPQQAEAGPRPEDRTSQETALKRALATANEECARLRKENERLTALMTKGSDNGTISRKTYMLILSCLHSDSRRSVSDEKLTAAFVAYEATMAGKVMSERVETEQRRREREEAVREAEWAEVYARGRRNFEERSRRGKAAWAKRQAKAAAAATK
jgi:hypothetical protein